MARKFFGTDGIRGRTNAGPMTAAIAMRVGQAAGAHFLRGDHRHRVVIGKDTRLSGYMMENALVAGFTSVGMDVVMAGPLPTPAIAMLTRAMRADLGVMISASHNPFDDNGIKLFGPDGYKLSRRGRDGDRGADRRASSRWPRPTTIGRARRIDDARGRYIHAVKHPSRTTSGSTGSRSWSIAPTAPPIRSRRRRSGSWAPRCRDRRLAQRHSTSTTASARPRSRRSRRKVVENGADIGLALDGDADRLIVVDEKGETVDGDQIMALIGTPPGSAAGELQGGGVVATVMSNLGLERFLDGARAELERTKVGDRYVLEAMRAGGYNVGGEQSGHMILLDHATTGDGPLAALQVLAALVRSGKPASELLHLFDPVPQLLKNVRFAGGKPLESRGQGGDRRRPRRGWTARAGW